MEADQKNDGDGSSHIRNFQVHSHLVYGATKTYTLALSKSFPKNMLMDQVIFHADGSIKFLSANLGFVATKMSKMKERLWPQIQNQQYMIRLMRFLI